MGCVRTAMANDPGAHLIARMDRLQVDVSHINWELEKLQLRLRWQKIAVAGVAGCKTGCSSIILNRRRHPTPMSRRGSKERRSIFEAFFWKLRRGAGLFPFCASMDHPIPRHRGRAAHGRAALHE